MTGAAVVVSRRYQHASQYTLKELDDLMSAILSTNQERVPQHRISLLTPCSKRKTQTEVRQDSG